MGAAQLKYQREHREQYRAYSNAWAYRWKKRAFDALGNKCAACGIEDWRVLQIDHIEFIGKDRPKKLIDTYKDVVIHPEKYQILCANDNWIKKYEKREF